MLVIYGGRSAEHEVSCVSAKSILAALGDLGSQVGIIGVTRDGRWLDATGTLEVADSSPGLPSPDYLLARGLCEEMSPSQALVRAGCRPDVADASEGPPVVLPVLHGPNGEDGTVQGLLEMHSLAYWGAGVAGSAAAMDKVLAKALLKSAGIPTVRYLARSEWDLGSWEDLTAQVGDELGWPVFVKPANLGSSVGVQKVRRPEGLRQAICDALRFDQHFLVEEAVRARELEIGVLGWPDLSASCPGEVIPAREFYDYQDKYSDGAARLEVPARLPQRLVEQMQTLAVKSCRALRVECMARVDFFLEEPGRGLLVNEVNTVPGFTPISMFPMAWAASGVPIQALVGRLIEAALRRHERRAKLELSPQS